MEALGELRPFHFPIAFPEVFLRDRAGFDVILGNPPWEEATLEEDDFWSRYLPGFQALPQHEQEAVKKRYRKNRPDLVEQFEREVAEADACATRSPTARSLAWAPATPTCTRRSAGDSGTWFAATADAWVLCCHGQH